MNWTARWHHVTQWGSGGDPNSGSNNCAEASLARAILEYNPSTPERKANARWDLPRRVHDPKDPATVHDLMNAISIIARGAPMQASNPVTTVDGIQAALTSFGLEWFAYYSSWHGAPAVIEQVKSSALAVLWVDGTALEPSSYSGAFFGGEQGYDHIILSLPDGSLCNDPLSDLPDRKSDVRYSWDALAHAIGGAWVLPSPIDAPLARHAIANCDGKPQANHICNGVAHIKAGDALTPTGQTTPHWTQVKTASGVVCWVLTNNLQ